MCAKSNPVEMKYNTDFSDSSENKINKAWTEKGLGRGFERRKKNSLSRFTVSATVHLYTTMVDKFLTFAI